MNNLELLEKYIFSPNKGDFLLSLTANSSDHKYFSLLHQLHQPKEIQLPDYSSYNSQYGSKESKEVYLRALLMKLAEEKEQIE